MNAKELTDALLVAIANRTHAQSPGAWSVRTSPGCVMLVWTEIEGLLPDMYGDEPWTDWDGYEIIDKAGTDPWTDSGIDLSRHENSNQISVHQWVQWDLEPDDDAPGYGAEPHADQGQPEQGTAGAADEHSTPGEAPRTLQT